MKLDLQVRDVALLGAVALGGLLAWREWDKVQDAQSGTAAASGQLAQQPTASGILPGIAQLLPTGSTAAPASGAATVADLAAVNKQNQIDTLRRDLARINNDIDVLVVQASTIKAKTPTPEFRKAVIDDVWAQCKAQHRVFPTTQCIQAGTAEKAEAAVAPRWAERIALELQPVQAQLSRLGAEQASTVRNLAALGYTVPTTDLKKASV
ncbi:hypothetical protein V3W47_19020 [Deinococcus sp. YIM 134068]|uniref:hypothetical protein n=1 Tax=Deinococcus lichenicola TaxID=3118910 RepID=UPI002F93DDEF